MANTTEILRMMRHAAERLEEEDPIKVLPPNYLQYSDAAVYYRRALSQALANTYAASVLRMVAAVMDDQAEPAAPATHEVIEVGQREPR